ncbi:hypothetical protein JVT61DRAFT_7434 [Boletus reticuloceps]|uniref:Uncharacterized protein n=1 Tax=Boletus reticuloceps TaxID=495285 RepID=A0A8I2YIU1_9AGAM|nr:hypothetical protein JVT61DRAFT_7434 [Boletus reticuloceps]
MPVAGFSRGGSFLCMDTMQLTEISHFVDHKSGRFVTNQSHISTQETLCRLAMSFPIYPNPRSKY